MRPGEFQTAGMEGVVVERKQVIDELLRRRRKRLDRRAAEADARVQRIALGQRQADVGAEVVRVGQVVGDVGLS